MSNLYEYYDTGQDSEAQILNNLRWYAQNIEPSITHVADSVAVYARIGLGNPGDLTVSIQTVDGSEKPNGEIAVGTESQSSFTGSLAWVTVTLSSTVTLTAGTTYSIVLKALSGDNVNYYNWGTDQTSPTYDGKFTYTLNGGSTWITPVTTTDCMFREYGLPPAAPPSSDSYTTKQLVAIGAGEVWLENAAGDTMEQVADSLGTLDTSTFLSAFELYGKLFIVNGSTKKVLDLINTKITTADIGSHPPDFGTVLTVSGGSLASMIVDYVDSLSGACTIYGKRTTATTFADTETVTGTDNDGNSISFTLNDDEDAPPHYYDWTVYGADTTTYGSMPDDVTLGCNYRGRAVIAGNPDYPHQWYMSRQRNPWDFLYGANDPLSAVAGNNADAGEVGDIIRALAPYGDDFLNFGCANSIWLLDGDPCSGGSIDMLDKSTGIYGPKAWCKDNMGNLYFYGTTSGLYKMIGGREKPVNISYGALPNLVDDWAAVSATHRIVLSFDAKKAGILISRTTLATGANLNFWYDLKTEGFYPDTYPNACGIFSSYIYNSHNSDTRKLLFGCNDGYIRSYSDSAKDDDSGASDTAISSYCVLPLIKLNETDDAEGKLISLTFELAGGAASGAFSDTDGLSYELHVGDDAETVLEDIQDGATARESGTLTGTGRKVRIRTRLRGRWLGVKLYNSTASQTWAINLISGIIVPAGRIK